MTAVSENNGDVTKEKVKESAKSVEEPSRRVTKKELKQQEREQKRKEKEERKQQKKENGESSSSSSSDDDKQVSDDDEFWKDLPLYPKGTEDLLGNGDLLKMITKPGQNDRKPAIGDTVYIHYAAVVEESGAVFFSTKSGNNPKPAELKLGEHGNIRGIDLGVRTMTEGEWAKFTCKPHLAYLEAGMTRQKFIFQVELLRWDFGDDVTGDGEIFRCVQREGDPLSVSPHASGNVADPVAKLDVAIRGFCNDRQFLNDKLTFDLGNGSSMDLPDGIDVVLQYFKVGERSLIKFPPDSKWNYGATGKEKFRIPAHAELLFDITLLGWEEKEYMSYDSLTDKLNAAANFKEQGTRLLNDGKLLLALEKYTQAMFLLERPETAMKGFERKELTKEEQEREDIKEKTAYQLRKPATMAQDGNEERKDGGPKLNWGWRLMEARDSLYVTCLLNAALCHQRLNRDAPDAEETLRLCELALALSPGHVKALFRKAQALQRLRRWSEAIENYRKVLNFEPYNSAAIEQLRICKNPPRKEKAKTEEKTKFDKVYGDIVKTKKKAPSSIVSMPSEPVWTSVKSAK